MLLAAGQSSRMGRPKQLLPYKGQPMVLHAVQSALGSKLGPVLVVLGANASLLQPMLQPLPVHTLVNEQWQQGMASSIKAGLQLMLQQWPRATHLLIMLADQPFVTAHTLQQLAQLQQQTSKPAAACAYAQAWGTPAIFDSTFWPALLTLQGDTGARKLLAKHPEQVAILPFEKGTVDIDTWDDYQNLSRQDTNP